MLYTDILEQESWRVMEDDSKEEKSGRRVGSSVKGSRMRSRCQHCVSSDDRSVHRGGLLIPCVCWSGTTSCMSSVSACLPNSQNNSSPMTLMTSPAMPT